MQKKTVKISRAQKDTAEILKEAVKNAGLRGKQKIFVKPNMSHLEYVPGVVTSPALLRELVSLLRRKYSLLWHNLRGGRYLCEYLHIRIRK